MAVIWHGRSPSAGSGSHEVDPDGSLVESSRVGLITHKDCERAMAEALGIPTDRTGHFWGTRESLQL